MITVAQAQQSITDSVSCVCDSEQIMLAMALGRISSDDIVSPLFVPPTDNSAMDGFAIKANAVGNQTLPISQRIPAGEAPKELQSDTAARIFTGGVLPKGADTVVIQENCDYNDKQVTIKTKPITGANIRPKGQDIAEGDCVVARGKKLTAVDLGLIASLGLAEVKVRRSLRVAIFSTGDELVEPGQALREGQIYNSNRTMLLALCQQLGYQPIDCGIVEDTLVATKTALANAAQEADVVISSGGVSVGEEDHVKPAIESLGSLDLWKVQMKPGKPVAFGRIEKTPFLGLPGNPVSSYTVFQLFAIPLLAKLQGDSFRAPIAYKVLSGFDKATVSREEYIRVRLTQSESSELTVERFSNLSSGVLSSLSWADGLVRQKIEEEIFQGQAVEFLPFARGLL